MVDRSPAVSSEKWKKAEKLEKMEFPLTGLIETNSSDEAAVDHGRSLYSRKPCLLYTSDAADE